jgi:hypothetical protein
METQVEMVAADPGAVLTDEQILGIDPPSPKGGFGGPVRANEGRASGGAESAHLDEKILGSGDPGYRDVGSSADTGGMPAWVRAAAADATHGAEVQALWSEHQGFRAAFSSPEEARAIKELFPGGAPEAQNLKQSAQSVERIDAAIFSGDVRAQSEVVAEIARANPAAFRSLFAEAAKVLAGLGVNVAPVGANVAPGTPSGSSLQADSALSSRPTLSENREVGRTQNQATNRNLNSNQDSNQNRLTENPAAQITNHPSQSPKASDSRITNHDSRITAPQSPTFDPAAYASFERTTNDVVARDVRSTISDTLARVLPEGIAEGAARRIGDDIFNEVHRALAADPALSQQVGQALRGPLASGQGWRFGTAEQQQVASLLTGRARQLMPSVARRVIGEWTSSVLGASRSKASRQAAAASRVDIAAPGGSLDSMPLRAMSSREVNYAAMSDDEILGM